MNILANGLIICIIVLLLFLAIRHIVRNGSCDACELHGNCMKSKNTVSHSTCNENCSECHGCLSHKSENTNTNK